MDAFLSEVMVHIWNTSYQAAIVAAILLVARLALRWGGAPKKYACILWYILLLRLLLPIHLPSALSLFPGFAYPVPDDIMLMGQPEIHTGFPALDHAVSQFLPAPPLGASANPMQIALFLQGILWAAGMAACLAYGLLSALYLKRRLPASLSQEGNVYLADGLPAAVLFGIFRPRIYLPSHIPEGPKAYVICHEQQHVRRKDHLVKAVFFLLCCAYWFHPLLWLAYVLAGRDMEAACDEAVAEGLPSRQRKEYAEALPWMAAEGKKLWAAPLAFPERNARKRMCRIARHKKPGTLARIWGIAVILFLGIGLLTDPPKGRGQEQGNLQAEALPGVRLEGDGSALPIPRP